MQILIVGCGNVGIAIAEQLSTEGHDITAIDERSDNLQYAVNAFDIRGIVGNGASFSILKDAGVETSDMLLAVTDSDELNMLCCLIGKRAGAKTTVARVRNPVYKQELNYIKSELDINMVINPEEIAAAEAARSLKYPLASKVESFARGRAEMVQMRIEKDSPLRGKSLMEIRTDLAGNVIFAIVQRGDEVYIPYGSFVLQEKDEVSIVAPSKELLTFFKKAGIPTAKVRDAILIGGGQTAFYLARQLLSMGVDVKIFEKEKERCAKLSEALPEAMIINGDGTDKDMLMEEGLAGTDAFIALTGIDEENIMMSLFTKSVSKAKLITKLTKVSYNDIIGEMEIGTTLYPRLITAERIIRYVRGIQESMDSEIETLYRLCDGRVEALEFLIKRDAPVIGVPLQELRMKRGLIVACINHRGDVIVPNGSSTIAAGDTVIVVTRLTGFKDITDILEKS
ncbi:MAG: Trk system potassium transporter TrkA [Lachnospiraceae bacterium]|nr:Trk system potassium transporter TrkA [Lachnospiraceae bacterium]